MVGVLVAALLCAVPAGAAATDPGAVPAPSDAAEQPAGAMGDEASGARRRERRSASELGTRAATGRVVAQVTQPALWEPGVT